MFGRTRIMKSTGNYSDEIKRLKKAVEEADAVVIGAGAGLSTSAGFVYNGERFEKHFSDFGKKYGFKDMYSGGFYPYETSEEMWAYWSKFIFVNRYMDAPKPVYEQLLSLQIIVEDPQIKSLMYTEMQRDEQQGEFCYVGTQEDMDNLIDIYRRE